MATATLSYNLETLIGDNFDPRRTRVTVAMNVPLIVVDGTTIRPDDLPTQAPASDGTGSFTLVTTNSAVNPTSFAYTFHVDYVLKGNRQRRQWSSSEFTFTTSANIAAISEAFDGLAISPTWQSEFRDEMELIAGLTGEDSAIANRLNTTTSLSYAAFRDQESFRRRTPSTRYLPISGVIRKTAGVWAPIADGAHMPTNIGTIEIIDDIRIRMHYGVTGSIVGTLGAWLDESYAYYGYHIGASVNPDYADFYVYQTRNVAGYVAYDGTNWTSSPANEFRNITFSAGVVSMEHDTVGGANLQVTPRTNSSGTLRAYFGGTVTGTTTQVEIRTVSTNAVLAAPDASVKMYVDRGVARRAVKISEMPEGSTNLWIFGLMEV